MGRVARLLAAVATLACGTLALAQSRGSDNFAVLNGVRLHYVDWGGRGDPLIFLTGLGGSPRDFDLLVQRFTPSCRVIGLTRRGQGTSEKPPSGYDTRTLTEDIRALLDHLKIERATLIGYSVAGDEMTMFAGLYPFRVARLVYLDAAGDRKSGHELANNPATRYPLPLPTFTGPLGKIVEGARAADPDYSRVLAPALSFVTVYDEPFIPPDADANLRERLLARWRLHGEPFQRRQIERFKKEMRNGRVIELRDTHHGSFLTDTKLHDLIERDVRSFLGGAQ